MVKSYSKCSILGDNCNSAGFMMMCVASRTSSPWHNFVTDTDHWEEESGANLCLNDGGIYNHPKVASIQAIGA